MNNEDAHRHGLRVPLDYRFFLVTSLTMTSATATSTARRSFSTNFREMNATTPLRPAGLPKVE